MADIFTKVKRSEVMSLIRSKGNKGTEMRLVSLMRELDIIGWRRHFLLQAKVGSLKDTILKVRPDFVFRRERLAVFVDGCFWHGCPRCYVRPKQNRKFWGTKVAVNQARDLRQSRALKAAGWKVLRIWECALTNKQVGRTMGRLQRALASQSIKMNPKT